MEIILAEQFKKRPLCLWTMLFSIALFLGFPLYFKNSYLDILNAKTEFFSITGAVYVGVGIVFYGMELYRLKQVKIKPEDIFCLFFSLSVLISSVKAGGVEEIFYGIAGPMPSAKILILCCIIYFIVSKSFILNWWSFGSCILGVGMVSLFAILNRMGIDPLYMYPPIDPTQIDEYLSTIGQINIVAGYLCIFFPFLLGMYVCLEKGLLKYLCGATVILCYLAGICTNSDSFFLGFAIGIVFSIYLAMESWDRMKSYVLLAGIISFATLLLEYGKRVGHFTSEWGDIQSLWMEKLPWLIFTVLCLGGYFFIRYKKPDIELKKGKKFYIMGIVISSMLAIVIILMVNIFPCYVTGNLLGRKLIFNDSWGTNRGYVWKRTWKLFLQLPISQKIFGIGLNGFSEFFDGYYMDSVMKFGYYFEDAHNEFLQYLVTIGLFGTFSYYGMLVCSIISCFRERKEIKWVVGMVLLAYIAQGMVNNPLIFSIPYVFVFMGMEKGNKHFLIKDK